jgi:beta-mannan synthase
LTPCAGLLGLQRAQEWVVTTKLGSSDRRPGTVAIPTAAEVRSVCQPP